MFTSLSRIIRSSWINFWRQGGLSFATCLILVMAISFIGSLFLLQDLTNYAVTGLEEKVDISVYFKKDSLEEEILAIKEQVEKIPEVENVEYVSREEALERFTQMHQNDSELIESITEIGENPLLAALNIKAQQLDQYERISEFLSGLESQEIIEKVDYFQRRPIIERIGALASGMRTAVILISIVLSLIAVSITFNTIRLAIFNQKEEISIQRLVGASNWFIRGPFLVQGTMAGILSGLISFSFLALLTWLISPRVSYLFADLDLFGIFTSNFLILLSVQIATGIILGTASSLIAIRKYLIV
ncbi:MAG: permease-like cell division protein FtsX [Patescibacteria group bacterium]